MYFTECVLYSFAKLLKRSKLKPISVHQTTFEQFVLESFTEATTNPVVTISMENKVINCKRSQFT